MLLNDEQIKIKYFDYKYRYKDIHRLVCSRGEYIIESYNKRIKQFFTSKIISKQEEKGILSFIGLGYKEYNDEVYAMKRYIEYCDALEAKNNQKFRIV